MSRSLLVALTFWLLLAVSIALEEIFYFPWAQTSAFAISSTVVLTVVTLAWVLTHARENGKETSALLNIAVVAIAVIAVPYYRFRYYGAISGLKFVGWVVLASATVTLALIAMDFLVNGAGVP